MEHVGFESVDKAVQSAHTLSGLDTCTLWALIAMGLLIYEWWRARKEFESQTEWRNIREKQIASEVAQTEVMKGMIQELSSMKMMLTKYLLKE